MLKEKQIVQPYYLIDPNRRSLRNEIKARTTIKNRLFQEYPHTKSLLKPTFFYEEGDITPDEEITEAYNIIRQIQKVDYQYSWLSRFCKQLNIWDMELCEQSLGQLEELPATRFFGSFLVQIENSREAKIDEIFKDTALQTLFKYFRFPIRGYTRQEMEAEAEAQGWASYLYMTWSCHHPVQQRYPCGTCGPCQMTIKQGYANRIPWRRRLYAWSGLEKWRSKAAKIVKRVYPNIHKWKG